jgi:hypothetical protein
MKENFKPISENADLKRFAHELTRINTNYFLFFVRRLRRLAQIPCFFAEGVRIPLISTPRRGAEGRIQSTPNTQHLPLNTIGNPNGTAFSHLLTLLTVLNVLT